MLFFFLWGFIKDRVCVSPLLYDLPKLRHRIEEEIASVTPYLLSEVCEELAFVRKTMLFYLHFDVWFFVNSPK